jgi:hypothetical protein
VIAPFLSFNLMTMSPASFSTISACNSTVFDIYASFRRHATVPLRRSKELSEPTALADAGRF